MTKKSSGILPAQNYDTIPEKDWIATITLETECGKDPRSNEYRLSGMKRIVEDVIEKTEGDGIILFPAGWLNTGKERADTIYPQVNRHIFVVIGIDGYQTEEGNDRDQIGIAVDKHGIQAIGRKHHCTIDDIDAGLIAAKGPNELEQGKPRIFELNGAKYYLAVCYDITWAHNVRPVSVPEVSAILNIIHIFAKDYAKGFSDFVRKGMGLESKYWKCPVFASVKFIDGRTIPDKWSTGIYWKFGEGATAGTPGTTIDRMSLEHQPSYLEPPLVEGSVDIRIFKDIPGSIRRIKDSEIPVNNVVRPKKIRSVKPKKRPIGQFIVEPKGRERFMNVVTEFQKNHPVAEIPVTNMLNRKGQFRLSFPGWREGNRDQNNYIFYEFEDWAYQGKDEISVEVMFSTENFREIAEEICAQKDSIAEKIAPNLSAVCNRTVSKGFIRVQFVFPDDVEAARVARAMTVLIENTKDIINEWLKSENKSHY